MKTSQKSGALQRGFRIGKLGFGLVGSYLGYQAQNLLLSESGKAQRRSRFQKKASQQVSAELGALKGAAMKVGQLLSMQSGVFPEETLRELAALQSAAFLRSFHQFHPPLRRKCVAIFKHRSSSARVCSLPRD